MSRRGVGHERHAAGVRQLVELDAVDRLVGRDVDVRRRPWSSFSSSGFGTRTKFSPLPSNATLTAPTFFASFTAFYDHAPVTT